MAYQSNLLGDFWRSYRQKRIGTGNPLSKNEIGGLLGPMLEYDAQKTREAGAREQQQNQFNANLSLQERARKDQALASTVGGVGQLAMLPMAYGAGKNLGWWGKPQAGVPVPPGQVPLANAANTAQGSLGLLGGNTAQGALTAPAAGAAPFSGATPALSYGAGGEVGGGLGSGAAITGGGAGLTAGAALGVGGVGLLGGALGSSLAQKFSPIGGQREKQIGGGIAGGAAAGAAMGSVVPGVGTLIGGAIGGIIGGISSLF